MNYKDDSISDPSAESYDSEIDENTKKVTKIKSKPKKRRRIKNGINCKYK